LSLEHQLKRVKLESWIEKIKSQCESIKLKLKPKFENNTWTNKFELKLELEKLSHEQEIEIQHQI